MSSKTEDDSKANRDITHYAEHRAVRAFRIIRLMRVAGVSLRVVPALKTALGRREFLFVALLRKTLAHGKPENFRKKIIRFREESTF